MRRHATNIFSFGNRRRGEWNPLLLMMFALLTVAPSVLAAAPIHSVATQPQAVWQWLQSPEGAPTRDLLQQALSECGMQGNECGILDLPRTVLGVLRLQNGIDSPLPHSDSAYQTAFDTTATEPLKPPVHPAVCISHSSFSSSLSSHEAAKLSGIRTNRRLN